MRKDLRRILPVGIGVLVIILLLGVRAYGLKSEGEGRWPDVDGGYYEQPILENGIKYLIPPDEVYENGLGQGGIPEISSPKYVGVYEADEVLADEVEGISVEVNGKKRFYSFQILNWHQLVNDTFEGKDLLISYSPLCGSAVVYERSFAGDIRTFKDAGTIYNNCPLILTNDGNSTIDQVTGKVVIGDRAGEELVRYPSTVMRWDEWRDENLNGEVLSTDTGFVREYRRHPYGNYDTSNALFFPLNHSVETGLKSKDVIYDVVVNGMHAGFSAKLTAFMPEPNYTVGEGESAVNIVALSGEGNAFRLFNRNVNGQTLTFVHEGNVIKDKETDSRWNASGEAVSGELKGTKLSEIFPTARYFALAYRSHFGANTAIPGIEIFNQNKEETKPEGETLEINAAN